MRKTKIICTIGPSSSSEAVLEKLIKAGMNVARINFSHGDYSEHKLIVKRVRKLSKKLRTPVAILADLAGPKIRTGKFKDGSKFLKNGESFNLTTTHPNLYRDVKKGNTILLNDGLVKLRVTRVKGKDIICEVIEGGLVHDHSGVNLPGIKLSISSFTPRDKKNLAFAISQNVDYIGISFVRSAKDVAVVKKLAKDIPLIAKLEKPEAMHDLDNILAVSDGVMVARGDLGVETSPEVVPMLQKEIIEKARRRGKIAITATQMLESMVEHIRPTRAEASDVANAILDGTDAVMLSEETAAGKYPIEATAMMAKIADETEESEIYKTKFFHFKPSLSPNFPQLISDAASHISNVISLKGIVVFTQTGGTGKFVSNYRPSAPIYAFTPDERVWRRLALVWGIKPLITKIVKNTDEIIHRVDKHLVEEKIVKKGDKVAIIFSTPIYKKRPANLLKLHYIGESD